MRPTASTTRSCGGSRGRRPDRVLVIKISGLYGKPAAYSSYQPKESVIRDPTEAD